MAQAIDIFEFIDYRKYLESWLSEARKQRTSNLTRLAEQIGVHTSFLAHVLSGEKNLSSEQAAEVAEILGFTNLEREFFFGLVQLERSGSSRLRKYWQEKLETIRKERKTMRSRVGKDVHELSSEDRAVFYSSWIYVAVFVATGIDDGQTLEQIAERFRLPRAKALEILEFLCKTGVCERNGARYITGKAVVYLTSDSPLVVKHHSNWRLRALHKMDTKEPNEMFFTSPMSMSRADMERVREVLAKAIESIMAICKDSPAEEVVDLNIDFFRAIVE